MEDIDCQTSPGEARRISIDSRGWFAFFTGLNLAFFVCYLMCKPSWNRTPSFTSRLSTSVLYLVVACCAGALGTWMMLPGDSRQEFRTLLKGGARGWIFLPAIALSLQLDSIWAQLLAVLSAAFMATYLYQSSALDEQNDLNARNFRQGLFTAEIGLAPASRLSFSTTLLVYAALLAAVTGNTTAATAFLAAAIFLVVIKFMSGSATPGKRPRHLQLVARRAQPYLLLAIAFYFIFNSLSYVPNSSSYLFKLPGMHSNSHSKQPADPHASSAGYRTIVLWPEEKPEKVVAPARPHGSSFGAAKPMVIPFFGPYWYFKYPGEVPGPNSSSSRGDPLKANVRSTDAYPLLMEANQHLADPIDMDCCSELQIVFRNDVSVGAIAVGISLTDSHSPSKLSQNLGVKVVASPVNQDLAPGPPTEETLTFRFPRHGVIQRFDDIDVTFVPDPRHQTAGRKVAVERFVLIPN